MKALRSWLKLTRAEHAVLSAAGVLVAIFIALKASEISFCAPLQAGGLPGLPAGGACLELWKVCAALLAPVLINLGAFAINDYFDIGADRENKMHGRPLVSGEIKPAHAAIFGAGALIFGGLLGFAINFEAGAISSAFAIVSFLYNWKLKEIALLGNLFISFSMGIAFIFGAVSSGLMLESLPLDFWILAIGASAAGLGREIVKTVQDLEGDKKARGSRTLPVLFGERNSLLVAAGAFVLFSICIGWLALNSQILRFNTLSLGLLAIGALSYLTFAYLCALGKMGRERIEEIRKLTLQVLAVVMLGVFICAI
ncbi:MAG: UbiA family prenyltransferase [Candidatus Micrarchaeota archaeon]